MAEIDISLPEQARAFVDLQVAQGRYANASAYIADLIQADAQEQLKVMVQEGLASPSRESTDEVWSDIKRVGATRLAERG